MDTPISEAAQTSVTRPDQDSRLWASFATAGSTDSLCRAWLALQCRDLAEVACGTVLLARSNGPFQPVAVWPDVSHDFTFLHGIAEECLKTAAPVVRHPPHDSGAPGIHIAYPFVADGGQPAGAVVLDLRPRPDAEVRSALRRLHWGIGWLEAQAMRDRIGTEKQRVAGAAAALDIVAIANEYDRVDAAAMAVANEMATRLGADRVAIGLDTGRGIRLMALSHTAWFRRNTAMVTGIQQAMEEAADQRATILVPAQTGGVVRIQVAHEALTSIWEAHGAFTTFPLMTDRGPAGAITLLHRDPPTDTMLRLGEAICALLGPILDHKRRARRLISGRLVDWLHDFALMVTGPRHIGWKLAGAALSAAVLASVLIQAPFRVSAKAVLEGRVQRVVPAPFDGFIATAPAIAGDTVHAGDVLATLDDRDLQLERVRWASERERLVLKSREAMSKHDPGTGGQLDAQIRQVEAQAALTAEKLARTRIVAPIDGILVSGDLSHTIGAPVETGKVLFEIAPLDDYRVVVRVDERDIQYIVSGQTGQVLPRGMTGGSLPITVRRVTSVAETDAGHNTFRVEAVLESAPPGSRPGMEGVAKIEIANRSLAWTWTRGIIDWARMLIWNWTP